MDTLQIAPLYCSLAVVLLNGAGRGGDYFIRQLDGTGGLWLDSSEDRLLLGVCPSFSSRVFYRETKR